MGQSPTGLLALTDVSVVDVERGTDLCGQTVIIRDGRIDRIGATPDVAIPPNAQVIDGRGLYLMPGLVDAHVHYLNIPVFGRMMLANGILLVRDMGMPTEHILGIRQALNSREVLGPEMVATGAILDGDPAIIPTISMSLTTPDQARAAVAQHASAGVDMIKVYSNLGRDVLPAVIEEAKKHGLKVVGHAPESVYIEDAAAMGMSSSEHPFGFDKVIGRLLAEASKLHNSGMGPDMGYLGRLDEVDPDRLAEVFTRLAASGLTVCPTVTVFKVGTHMSALRDGTAPGMEFVPKDVLNMWRSMWAQQEDLPDFMWRNWARMVVMLHVAGVPLMVGTDLLTPGILPGLSVHEEMAIWQEAGIPAADVLRSATVLPAKFVGLGDRLGSIEPGKEASMVLVRANPLIDIRNAQQIEAIFQQGKYFARKDLDAMIDEARQMAQPKAE